jgi:CheY-like chemotaxis protein
MSTKTRVLVVEDNQVERADLAQMISSFGITPVTAIDGQDAIQKLDSGARNHNSGDRADGL